MTPNETNVQERPKPNLYLIRGLVGSGKSTYANSIGCIVIAPSDMMSHRGGQYNWIKQNYMISKIHFRKIVRDLMALQIDIAITELLLEERFINFWLKEAKDNYYQAHIKTLLIDLFTSENRNVHGVDHKSITECHEQMDYGIPDQIIDYSEGQGFYNITIGNKKWHLQKVTEDNNYGLYKNVIFGSKIRQLLDQNDLNGAIETHLNFKV